MGGGVKKSRPKKPQLKVADKMSEVLIPLFVVGRGESSLGFRGHCSQHPLSSHMHFKRKLLHKWSCL